MTLDGSGSTPASEIAKYRWRFGDGAEGTDTVYVYKSGLRPAQPEVVEGHPLIQWLILHGKAVVLKQFFEVSMIVQNPSPEPFTLAKGTATLNLPEGLSLAPTAAQQALTNEVLAVPGGGANIEAIKAPTMYPLEAPASIPGYVRLKWTPVSKRCSRTRR